MHFLNVAHVVRRSPSERESVGLTAKVPLMSSREGSTCHSADDICSSNALEVAASEFECQGLEVDWLLVSLERFSMAI